MNYFVVEGTILKPELMNDEILKKHMSYTQQELAKGTILLTSLKSDNSGGLFIIKAESAQYIEEYLSHEPLKLNGIQDYKITEIAPHFLVEAAQKWLD